MTEHDSNLCWCETCYYPEPYIVKAPRFLDEDEDTSDELDEDR